MSLNIKSLLLLASTPFVFSACSDTVSLERKLDRLEQSLNSMRSIQASHTSDLDTLHSEMQSLGGRLDEIQHFQDQRIGREVSVLRDDISSLKSRVPPPAIVPTAALEEDEPLLQGMNTSASRLVLDAIVFIREAKYSEADALIQNALEYGVEDAGFPYALFWGGVAADGRADTSNALRSYNEVVVKFSKHTRAPLALSRQADVFLRLRDKNAATFALKKLAADYPKTVEAATAKQKLAELSKK